MAPSPVSSCVRAALRMHGRRALLCAVVQEQPVCLHYSPHHQHKVPQLCLVAARHSLATQSSCVGSQSLPIPLQVILSRKQPWLVPRSTRHKVDISEKREEQLRKCLQKIGL